MMLQARVPAGRHLVELQYRPATFTAGVALAGVSALGLIGVLIVTRVRRRRGESGSAPEQDGTALP